MTNDPSDKPREFWVAKYGRATYAYKLPKYAPKDPLHVIEYAAYQSAIERVKRLEEKIKDLSETTCLLGHEDGNLCCLDESGVIEELKESP